MNFLKKRVLWAGLLVIVASIGLAQILILEGKRGSNASSRVEVGSLAQHIIGRNYYDPGTGRAYVCLYFPVVLGMPSEVLFVEGSPKSERSARLTARSTILQAEPPLPPNGSVINTLFSGDQDIKYYYQASPANQNWDNPDSFSDGEHVATVHNRVRLLTQIGPVAYFINSAPLTFSRDFEAADGKIYNFRDLSPGGLTAHILGSNEPVISPATAPFVAQIPISGTGIHMGSKGSLAQ